MHPGNPQLEPVLVDMLLQSKALGAQQVEVASAMAAAGEASKQWLAKLRGMEQLLYSAQSAQFVDIRNREAEAYKVYLHSVDQQSKTSSSCCMPQHIRHDGKQKDKLRIVAVQHGTNMAACINSLVFRCADSSVRT